MAALYQGEHWRCENTDDAGALWLKMCKFYALEFDNKETVICIRQRALLKRSEKKWTKRLPIEGKDVFFFKLSMIVD